MPSGAEVDAAAVKIQAVQRGKQDRKEMAEQQEAAVKMQAVQRGKAARKKHVTWGEGAEPGLP